MLVVGDYVKVRSLRSMCNEYEKDEFGDINAPFGELNIDDDTPFHYNIKPYKIIETSFNKILFLHNYCVDFDGQDYWLCEKEIVGRA